MIDPRIVNSCDFGTKGTPLINAKTEIYGVIGNPVRHSLSPIMHNAAFRAMGLNAVYLAFHVEDLPSAVDGIRGLGIRGINITIPHKWDVIELLDEIDPTAKALGAVNTIVNLDGKLVGHNTDWSGALSSLREKTEIAGKSCMIIGAGGAARALAYGLISAGADVIVVNRTVHKAQKIAQELGCRFAPLDSLLELYVDVLVNTTPVGMEPNVEESPVPPAILRPGMVVMDAVYAPLQTRLLREAKNHGCLTIDGLRWLVRQGAESFNIWLGVRPPEDVMDRACREGILLGRNSDTSISSLGK